MGNADTYIDMKGDGDAGDPLPLPDWFAGIRFGSWNATGTSERIVPRHLTSPPEQQGASR